VRRRKGGYSGAAPATVSGERLSNRATGAEKHWEGQTAAATREPGNLPRRTNILGRGVPVGRLRRTAAALPIPACVRSAHAPNQWGMPMYQPFPIRSRFDSEPRCQLTSRSGASPAGELL